MVVSRGMVLIFAVVIGMPWLVIASVLASRHRSSLPASQIAASGNSKSGSSAAAAASGTNELDAGFAEPPQEWVSGKMGPWGQIESMLFAIDVPEEFISRVAPPTSEPPVRWSFPAYSREKVLAALRAAGMTEVEVRQLDISGKWSGDAGVISVEPGDRLILSLTPEVRSKLYTMLVAFPQNAQQIDPIVFRPGKIDWRLQGSGLASESITLLKRLLYPQGEDALLFADLQPALRSLPGAAEQRRFLGAVARKRAVMVRLRLGPDTDVDELSRYWGVGGRRKDLVPLLTPLHRVKEGTINVVFLLPAFARDRLYSHPPFPDDASVPHDCFWSAFNFFNESPDNNAINTHSLQALIENYNKLAAPTQLGDLLILATRDSVPVHAAVFIADDIYFTKNGNGPYQPWILMRFADLLERYNVKYPGSGLGIHYFRRRGL